ncbi:uncharacterized protein LOC108222925 [Daucus carota subsp. sativus]
MCVVKIINVEESGSWWYISCIGCAEEVSKEEGRYKCICGSNSPVAEKRYKIVVLAGDETEALNFVLLDRAARRIVGQTATKLISDNLQTASASGYPAKIKEMIGKEYTFDIEVKEENVVAKSKIFYVNDAFQASNSFGADKSSDVMREGLSTSSFAESKIDLTKTEDTPTSEKSVYKKIKIEG